MERAATTDHRALRHAVRHYVEMVLAMGVGMLVLGGAGAALSAVLGLPTSWGPEIDSLLMATTMSVGMAVWMRHRRHGWAPVAEMCAAMYLPFVALFWPLWSGTISPDDLVLWGHVLMLPAMAAAMLLRPREYTCPHGAR
jgi:hypothetical protein